MRFSLSSFCLSPLAPPFGWFHGLSSFRPSCGPSWASASFVLPSTHASLTSRLHGFSVLFADLAFLVSAACVFPQDESPLPMKEGSIVPRALRRLVQSVTGHLPFHASAHPPSLVLPPSSRASLSSSLAYICRGPVCECELFLGRAPGEDRGSPPRRGPLSEPCAARLSGPRLGEGRSSPSTAEELFLSCAGGMYARRARMT